MDEIQHAFIVSEFYRLLKAHDGENGIAVFRMAAITYGEQRGKRMAMRALRDGHPLDYEGYFAYGEYPSTDAYFDVDMWDEQGVVNERVTRCPWATVFAERGMKECGVAYCREIDRAIVRGFNPELELETASTQHLQGCCRFYFRDQKVYPGLLEKAGGPDAEPQRHFQAPGVSLRACVPRLFPNGQGRLWTGWRRNVRAGDRGFPGRVWGADDGRAAGKCQG